MITLRRPGPSSHMSVLAYLVAHVQPLKCLSTVRFSPRYNGPNTRSFQRGSLRRDHARSRLLRAACHILAHPKDGSLEMTSTPATTIDNRSPRDASLEQAG